MDVQFRQEGFGVRFEWGPVGAKRLVPDVACLVVVDVLSFTTSVTVAVESGSRVYPYRWLDETAASFAEQVDARLAVARHEISATSPWSLSPASLRDAPGTDVPGTGRLVLPSPNGSTIAAEAGDATVVAGCLRNARAIGRWLAGRGWATVDAPVLVIASGERWPDGTMRPAIEDMLGAGAVISALTEHSGTSCSPEAALAACAWTATADVNLAIANSSSGRELSGAGFADDILIATELDSSATVPVLFDGAFTHVDDVPPTRAPSHQL